MKQINVIVAYATPEKQVEIPIAVEVNCTVAIAIRRSGMLEQFPEINFAINKAGLNGKLVKLDSLMQDGDRVEIYRPLIIDPKQARLNRIPSSRA